MAYGGASIFEGEAVKNVKELIVSQAIVANLSSISRCIGGKKRIDSAAASERVGGARISAQIMPLLPDPQQRPGMVRHSQNCS